VVPRVTAFAGADVIYDDAVQQFVKQRQGALCSAEPDVAAAIVLLRSERACASAPIVLPAMVHLGRAGRHVESAALNLTYCAAEDSATVDSTTTDGRLLTFKHVADSCGADSEQLMIVPGGVTRRTLRQLLKSEERTCRGTHPYVLDLRHFCPDAMAPDAGAGEAQPFIAKVEAAPVIRNHFQPSALASTAAVATSWTSALTGASSASDYACQFSVFVGSPALCRSPAHADRAIQQLESAIEELFRERSGFIRQTQAEVAVDATAAVPGRAMTYGELTTLGAVQMLDHVQGMFAGHNRITPDSVAFDLGSGVGKTVLAFAVLTPARSVTGIELMAARHAQAAEAKLQALQLGLLPEATTRRMHLVQGDALDQSAVADATHIYVANLCFSKGMNERLAGIVQRLGHVRVVMALVRLPLGSAAGGADPSKLSLGSTFKVQMTWSDDVPMFFYCRGGKC
jgi:hypothetical protein